MSQLRSQCHYCWYEVAVHRWNVQGLGDSRHHSHRKSLLGSNRLNRKDQVLFVKARNETKCLFSYKFQDLLQFYDNDFMSKCKMNITV